MDDAVVDTNILVSGAIGSARSASARLLDAYYDGRFRLVFSPATIDELLTVLTLPDIQARHGWSDDEIIQFISTLLAAAIICTGQGTVSAALTRDVTDTKFLALAAEAGATFLVTKDRRHLLRLKRYKGTRIVTPAKFLEALK
jgi:putative PIN family toxin of toxin-antitoxin system